MVYTEKMNVKPYPAIKSAIFLCILLIVIQFGAGIILDIYAMLSRLETSSVSYGIGTIIVYLLAFGLVILIGFEKTKKKFNDVFLFNKISWCLWPGIIVFSCGFVILSSELDNLINYFLPMPEFLRSYFVSVLANENIIISIISVALLPCFLEEMLFRGLILNGFKENYPVKKAILLSALFFGIVHLNPWQFVSAFIVGIISAWICVKTKSLLPCIYLHLFNNILFVFVTKFSDVSFFSGFNIAHMERTFQPAWLDATGLVLTGLGAFLIYVCLKKQERENCC
jgi:membrane protease YdiL (CAAX protease family)